MISHFIKEAKRSNNTLSVVWLDLAKTYPSVPHQLIRKALEHYQVPLEIIKLVLSSLYSLKIRFTVGNFTTKWESLEKGIMAGCTISVALFVAAMNLLLKVGGKQCKGPVADDNTRLSACLAFMDDITIMTPSIQGTQWILSSLEKMATWSWLQFKPGKSRSLCILKKKLRGTPSVFKGPKFQLLKNKEFDAWEILWLHSKGQHQS